MVHVTEYETKDGKTTVKKNKDGKKESAGNSSGKDTKTNTEAESWLKEKN